VANPLDLALQRALSIRLNLQITLSSMPAVEEWMDIHLDRWLEHLPMPGEMPPGERVEYLAMIGSDLRRLWWSAWGDPGGFVPKMADYFRLCNIAKSDERVLDELGNALEPKSVGSWVGVWGGKVVTGWHFCDPHPWDKIEPLFGTHEAKFLLKKWVADAGVERIERFTPSLGDDAFSELELVVPGETLDDQIGAAVRAFQHFTGAPPPDGIIDAWQHATPGFRISTRIRGGKIARFAATAPGIALDAVAPMCGAAKVGYEERVARIAQSMAGGTLSRVEYGRAGERAGVDVYVEPTGSPPVTTSQEVPVIRDKPAPEDVN
jgi:hypothetical protein